MGIWRKTLVYLGLVEEDDHFDEYAYDDLADDELQPEPAQSRRGSLRRVHEAEAGSPRREGVVRAMPDRATSPSVHHLSPTNFNVHAQELGDKFRDGSVVIMNLDTTPPEEAKRLKNFASGLVYGLRGSMKTVGPNVFLLSPEGVQVSAEEQQRLLDARGLFNEG
ncbi:MAG: cell division protein SepF [Actinomycetota bacterium]